MVGVVASVQRAFVARIGLAHGVVGSGELFTGAPVTMPEGPGTDGE
jgi:hypothetical protein